MNNKYVSLNRSLDNNQINNIINNANSILDKNNILKNITNNNFLKVPEQTRQQTSKIINNSQYPLLNSSQPKRMQKQTNKIINNSQYPLLNSSQPIIYIIQPPNNLIQDQSIDNTDYSYFDNVTNDDNNDDNNDDEDDNNNDDNNYNSSNESILNQNSSLNLNNKIPVQLNSDKIPNKNVIIKPHDKYQYSSNDFDDLKNNLLLIKKKLDEMPQNNNNIDIDCTQRIENVKIELLNKINTINKQNKNTKENYINNLFDILVSNELLTKNEVINIKKKINNNEIDQDTVITYLENKKKLSKQIFFNKELCQQISNVNYNYSNLLEGKWQVPMPRPPVCINNEHTKINQYDNYNSNFSTFK